MCVYIYICVYKYIYIYIYICMYVYVCVVLKSLSDACWSLQILPGCNIQYTYTIFQIVTITHMCIFQVVRSITCTLCNEHNVIYRNII